MTALKKYQRLECPGLWRETPQDQRREVQVRFGDATLILVDPKSGAALSHWSLPAIERLNPGEGPPLFAPGPDSSESLELDDSDMVEALDTVRAAVKAATARPGRLRGFLLAGTAAVVVAGAAFWLPGALVAHTASVVPLALRAEIGQYALDDLARVTGAPCDNQLGLQALAGLSERVFGPVDTPILYVLPEGVEMPLHLPGDVIVLPRRLIERANGPEAAAGAALVERLRSRAEDPMIPILNHAGLRATFQLLTTTDLPVEALRGYGEARLRAAPANVPDATLVSAFETAQVPATPYALAIDPQDAQMTRLAAADPYKGLAPSPLVPDEDWVALQGICGG
ncbi:hypothetical protein EI545_07110 [Tabrizicola piscis]|uniref:Uncharacterized protein n=1 Tax=Tabrizicola piscis TaxID=2494374 RepID=A0A3S8U4T8_9RHOB|nr:hypothetical protein [Tabrizicola piscis]AZL58624.1 hypothetical protein EI545_07110 [Tabrizicola piscis]